VVYAFGFDVGGANTKAALIHSKGPCVLEVKVASEYFPIWKDRSNLKDVLIALAEELGNQKPDVLGITMTAELSDAYQTKREGVCDILSCVNRAFPDIPAYVIDSNCDLISFDKAKSKPLRVASANWAATGWLVAQFLKNEVIVDVGSTSTSIIPIVNGKVVAEAKTDLDKLICGELVYTGSLRTNIATIVNSIPLAKGLASVSSELFALSGDVHLILGHIKEDEYTSETADGRGKSLGEAKARLARIICADTDMLNEKELVKIAHFIYKQQLNQIRAGLEKVYQNTKKLTSNKVPIVVTGLGKDFLARQAAKHVNPDEIITIDSILPKQAFLGTPAVGVALKALTTKVGEAITWTL
jgi:(4-(4-[2-(gamma-L-glutamylamino)ethyl]phenoxymethyl)furan-2-yl)methanamine synthase